MRTGWWQLLGHGRRLRVAFDDSRRCAGVVRARRTQWCGLRVLLGAAAGPRAGAKRDPCAPSAARLCFFGCEPEPPHGDVRAAASRRRQAGTGRSGRIIQHDGVDADVESPQKRCDANAPQPCGARQRRPCPRGVAAGGVEDEGAAEAKALRERRRRQKGAEGLECGAQVRRRRQAFQIGRCRVGLDRGDRCASGSTEGGPPRSRAPAHKANR